MHGLSQFLQFVLCIILIAVCALSVQLAGLAWVRIFRRSPVLKRADLAECELPHVLVQLPVCNEGPLAVRVAASAAQMDWPRDRMTIQLLDDGDGSQHNRLAADVRAVVPEGVNFHILRRGDRKGFKAGNLAFGLVHCDAPFVAIFDADFVPPPDFLRRTVPALLADSGLAFVQSRWGHANRGANWLTRVQGLLLDAHFAVEQEARFRAGLPHDLQWQRRGMEPHRHRTGRRLDRRHADRGPGSVHALHDAGLARRHGFRPGRAGGIAADRRRLARAAGALDQGPCPGAPASCFPPVWASDMPLWKKAAMTLQMCQFAFYMLAFASAAISLTLMGMGVGLLSRRHLVWPPGDRARHLLCPSAISISASACWDASTKASCIAALLLAVVFPSGLILANTRATFDAFFSRRMDFNRTTRVGEIQPAAGAVFPNWWWV